jgi:hypothetical protein
MVALGTAVIGFTSLALAQTTPALADPTTTLVAVGSDTIQDIYNQFSIDASGNLLGSYNAVNPVTQIAHEIITPVDGTSGATCSFARPNGSGEGVANLRLAINPATTNGGAAVAPVAGPGCVDIARSSSGPGALQSNTGPLVYVHPCRPDDALRELRNRHRGRRHLQPGYRDDRPGADRPVRPAVGVGYP